MNETPMLFPITPGEFWRQIRTTIEEVVTEKVSQQALSQTRYHLPEKVLLKATDVCEIFQVSKPKHISTDKYLFSQVTDNYKL